jgi:hypothetical protein
LATYDRFVTDCSTFCMIVSDKSNILYLIGICIMQSRCEDIFITVWHVAISAVVLIKCEYFKENMLLYDHPSGLRFIDICCTALIVLVSGHRA